MIERWMSFAAVLCLSFTCFLIIADFHILSICMFNSLIHYVNQWRCLPCSVTLGEVSPETNLSDCGIMNASKLSCIRMVHNTSPCPP